MPAQAVSVLNQPVFVKVSGEAGQNRSHAASTSSSMAYSSMPKINSAEERQSGEAGQNRSHAISRSSSMATLNLISEQSAVSSQQSAVSSPISFESKTQVEYR